MSSTFALPNTLLGSMRRPRLRRTVVTESTAVTGSTGSTTVTERTPVVAIETVTEAPAMPFLRTPASWQTTGRSPVSYLDHVAVAPTGVLAITTRFHLSADDDEHVSRAWQDIRRAKGAAKLLELTLADDEVAVRPVLVIWGPGAPVLENGYLLVKGVYVLDPARPETWAHLFDSPALDADRLATLVDTLTTLQSNSNDAPIACVG